MFHPRDFRFVDNREIYLQSPIMSQRRFTVVQRIEFEERLAALWMLDHEVQRSMDDLELVLRTVPDQAGTPFYHQGEQLWHIKHRAVEILYKIVDEDCQVQLITIRMTQT